MRHHQYPEKNLNSAPKNQNEDEYTDIRPESITDSTSNLTHSQVLGLQRTLGNRSVTRLLSNRTPSNPAQIQRLIGVGTSQVSPVEAFGHFYSDPQFQVNDAAFPSGQAAPTRLATTSTSLKQTGGDVKLSGKLKEKLRSELTTYHTVLDSLDHYDDGIKKGVDTNELINRLHIIRIQAQSWLGEHTKMTKEQTRRQALQELITAVDAETQRLNELPTTTASTGMMARLNELSNNGVNFLTWQALFADASTQQGAPQQVGVSLGGTASVQNTVLNSGRGMGIVAQHPLVTDPTANQTTVYERIHIPDIPVTTFGNDPQSRDFEQVMVVNTNVNPQVTDHHYHPLDGFTQPFVAGEYRVFQTYAVGPRKPLNRKPDNPGQLADFASFIIIYKLYQVGNEWYFEVRKQGEGSLIGARFHHKNGQWVLGGQF